jgi:hypothetical protein
MGHGRQRGRAGDIGQTGEIDVTVTTPRAALKPST